MPSSASLFSALPNPIDTPRSAIGVLTLGLGNIVPLPPKLAHDPNRPPGDASRSWSIYLDGRAEIGVSILLFLFSLYAFVLVDVGGAGRAKGLGGPVAPADSTAEADGDGGGRMRL